MSTKPLSTRPWQHGFDEEGIFRSLFAAYPDALIVADLSGAIVLANPSAAALLGYTVDELVDRVSEQGCGRGVGEHDRAAQIGNDQRIGIGREQGAKDAFLVEPVLPRPGRKRLRAHGRPRIKLTGGTRI